MAARKEIIRLETILPAVLLVLGLLVGAAIVPVLQGDNSGMKLIGEKKHTIPVGDTEVGYLDEGVACFYFGIDCSDYVEISTNLTKNSDGVYIIDTSVEGVYYIAYTSTHPIFERDVRLVRTFTVKGGTE